MNGGRGPHFTRLGEGVGATGTIGPSEEGLLEASVGRPWEVFPARRRSAGLPGWAARLDSPGRSPGSDPHRPGSARPGQRACRHRRSCDAALISRRRGRSATWKGANRPRSPPGAGDRNGPAREAVPAGPGRPRRAPATVKGLAPPQTPTLRAGRSRPSIVQGEAARPRGHRGRREGRGCRATEGWCDALAAKGVETASPRRFLPPGCKMRSRS